MAENTDETTTQALGLFNQFLARQADREKADKAIAKAERQKNEAAGVVRKLQDDPKATAEAKAEAEAAYRAAVDAYNALKTGSAPAEEAEAPSEEGAEAPAEDGAEAPAEEAEAEPEASAEEADA
ncbi:MAG: hypothetical protein KDB21_02390 [Acidimicrobiales bacterium]|nr:hypothetical protein [Acidimicrobiales bacterium]